MDNDEKDDELLKELIVQRSEINVRIQKLLEKSYRKYGMSEIVKDDNPYSRLMALKKMGIVENYEVWLLSFRKSEIKVF